MPTKARHVFVSGRVQGVAFRWTTQDEAQRLGVSGWVRNLVDGRVEIWAEGDAPAVDALLRWLERGPPAARVDALDVRERNPEALDGFELRRTGI